MALCHSETIPVGNGLAPFRHHPVGNGLAPFRTISRHSAPFLAIPSPTDKLSNHRKGPSPFPTNGPIETHRVIPHRHPVWNALAPFRTIPHHHPRMEWPCAISTPPRREWPCAIPHHFTPFHPTDIFSSHRKGSSPFPTNGPIEIHRAIPTPPPHGITLRHSASPPTLEPSPKKRSYCLTKSAKRLKHRLKSPNPSKIKWESTYFFDIIKSRHLRSPYCPDKNSHGAGHQARL